MGNSSSNSDISRVALAQELERLNFSNELRKNPQEYNLYVNTRINEMVKEISEKKNDSFKKAQIDLGRYMDMDHNANFYKVRNSDVDRLTKSVSDNNNSIAQGLAQDKQISKRQFEINEWYNQNKLETLFFLQMFFVTSLGMILLLSLVKAGYVPVLIAAIASAIMGFGVIFTGVYRYYYTEQTRDVRLWNRRKFGQTAAPVPVPEDRCPPADEEEEDDLYMNDIAEGVGSCAAGYGQAARKSFDENGQALMNIGSTLNQESINAVRTGKVDVDWQGALNKVCPGSFDLSETTPMTISF